MDEVETAQQRVINVTEHAIKRYWERVPSSNDLDRPQVERVIRDRLAQALFLYEGNMGASSDAKFYLHDGLILVVSADEAAVVTLYPVDYGFGPEIDEMITKRLLKEFTTLQQQVKRVDEQVDQTQASLSREMATLESRATTLRAELEMIESAKVTLNAKQAQTMKTGNLLKVRLRETAEKLILSKRYNVETLAEIQTAARAGTGRK